MRILSGHWKLSEIESCPYRGVRLYNVIVYCISFPMGHGPPYRLVGNLELIKKRI